MSLKQPVNQKRLTNIAIVSHECKVNNKKYRFEIACYKNKVIDMRKGAETDLSEVLQTSEIFSSVTRGELSTKADLLAVFKTTDSTVICKEILAAGNLRVGDKEREHSLDSLVLDVINQTTYMLMDAKSGIPLTNNQIQSALDDLGFRVKPCPSKKKPEEHAKLTARDAAKLLEEKLPEKIQRVNSKLEINVEALQSVVARRRLLEDSDKDDGEVVPVSVLEGGSHLDDRHGQTEHDTHSSSEEIEIAQPVKNKKKKKTKSPKKVKDIVSVEIAEEGVSSPLASESLHSPSGPPSGPSTTPSGTHPSTDQQQPLPKDLKQQLLKLLTDEDCMIEVSENKYIPLDEHDLTTASNSTSVIESTPILRVLAHPRVYREITDTFGSSCVHLLDGRVFIPITKKPKTTKTPEPPQAPVVDTAPKPVVVAPVVSPTSTNLCSSCGGVGFKSTDELRTHFRSSWHGFNKKRQVKNMPPMDRLEFECLPDSLKAGFQAVDDY